jgi:twitching motility two-component system response regulator PilH
MQMSTVLIVDDSATAREMVAGLLKKIGLDVIEARDGVEAQEKLQGKLPDLVVMDIIMPRMNGYDLCRWLRRQPQGQNIPILMCSSKSEEFDRYWGMKQGADAYITKPFHPSDLVGTVKQLLNTNAG